MDYMSEKVKKLTPYVSGIQPKESGWIKLNTNENPYPPSPNVIEAIKEADHVRLRLYPDTMGGSLPGVLAEVFGVATNNVFCGNGSDEVLALAYQAFYSSKENVLMPDISYGFYPVWGEMYDVGVKTIPLREDFSIGVEDYKGSNGGVIIANPGAPTSLALEIDDIEKITQQNPGGVVIVDEAYINFSSVKSAIPLTAKYPNLLIIRTFSKSHALAGLRVGYAIGNAELIGALRRIKNAFNSYPLDMLAQIGASQAILDSDYYAQTIKKVASTRDWTSAKLREMGYKVLNSQTNFIFMEVCNAKGLYEHLYSNKILSRYWEKPRISNYMRTTVGTDAEMEAFIECVKRF